MVRLVKYTLAFFRLIRFNNLLIIGATMYFLRWFVLVPVLKNHNLYPLVSEKNFLLLAFATLCIAGGGYAINDYFDRKADLINRPGKVILGRILSRRTGIFWHSVLTFTGVLLGSYVSFKVGNLKYSFVFLVISGLLWFYSTTYKRQVLLGNLIVAVLVACIPLLVLLYEFPVIRNHDYIKLIKLYSGEIKYLIFWFVGYSVFAFLLTLMREIVKDLEDFEGDFAFGRQTIPIAWGADVAKVFVIVLGMISVVLITLILYKLRWSIISLIYGIVMLIAPLIFEMIIIRLADCKKRYSQASNLLKMIMLSGMVYMLIASKWVL
jgi:4-hydroxybenzoate polyprenyltransferase